MSLDMFFQHFFNALTLGSLYGLIAIGYTMVYGILRLINFAHGDILMLGAYFVFYGTTTFFLPWGVAVVVAILAASAVGILVDRIAYRPLRDARAFRRSSVPSPCPSSSKASPWWCFPAFRAPCTSRNGS